ncbi:C-X-C chemokine receptor type 5 [Callorhinchus milii]|uniref:Chemokine (C-X-C motif) receptor 5 n=1 Tax=Callorhinchus milii TaxID=7868 RepID=A0A4W3IPI9_CALMI|nr:C-X-C chemokine receptor type 5 [Callorhinchus milii]|eukprot:gi/632984912/ref/XP_007909385.1/ PREDICTED: C-X-C chemokine receptor type 5 [Callorhinchus milii]
MEIFQNLEFPGNENDTSYYYGDGYVCNPRDEFSLESQTIAISVVSLLVSVMGVLGNGLVLTVLICTKHTRTPTDSYLLHLTLIDLLLSLSLPFTAIQGIFQWYFGQVVCKMVGTMYKLNFFCSSLLLGFISFDRYLAIVYAVQTYKKRKQVVIHCICAGVWALCLLLQLPNTIYLRVETQENKSMCTYPWASVERWLLTEQILYHVLGFALPLLVMCYCYTMVGKTLWRCQNFKRRKAVRVVLLVTAVFFLCWTPFNLVIFINTLSKLELINSQSCHFEHDLGVALRVTECIGSVRCCLNPILYAFIGVKFRNDVLKLLREMGCISQATLDKHFQLKQTTKNRSSTLTENQFVE